MLVPLTPLLSCTASDELIPDFLATLRSSWLLSLSHVQYGFCLVQIVLGLGLFVLRCYTARLNGSGGLGFLRIQL
jgi:hypothetical protein